MKTFNVSTALQHGVLNLYRLQDDNYVFLIVTDACHYLVPLIKNSDGALAYVDTSDINTYMTIDLIVKTVFSGTDIYSGMYKYTSIKATAPTYDKRVECFINPNGGAKAANADQIMRDAGFNLDALSESMTAKPKLSYKKLLDSDLDAQQGFEIESQELSKVNATFDDLNKETQMAFLSLENGLSKGVIFEGPTGVGKSFAARILANKMGAPLKVISINEGTDADDFVGSWIPDTEKSGYKFAPGPLLIAYTQGWQIVIEEINFGKPGVLAQLNPFLDATPLVTIKGNTYLRNPNFVVYMTMNPGYKGTDTLNTALKNRFAKISIPALTKSDFAKRAMAYSKAEGHELSADFFQELYDFAALTEKEGQSSKWHEDVRFSIRNAQRLCDIILTKQCSFDEFRAAIAVEYLNDLSTDNDNSEELEKYKNDPMTISSIKKLYDLYDFATVVQIVPDVSFEDLINTDGEEETAADMADKKLKENLFNKFGSKIGGIKGGKVATAATEIKEEEGGDK